MKLIKRLFKILIALLLLILVAAVVLVFVFDPNMFKPRLEAAAREQGVQLNIDGNLGWQLWPALGVEVNDIRVAALDAPDQPIASLGRASLRLAVRPLLNGDLEVHHLVVEGAHLDLHVDEAGEGNWEALISEEPPPGEAEPTDREAQPTEEVEPASADGEPGPAESEPGEALQLAVERVSIRNAALRYSDAGTGQAFDLSDLNLELSAFNLQGDPFDLALDWRISIEDQGLLGNEPLTVNGQLQSHFQMATDMSEAQLSGGELNLELARTGASGEVGLTFALQASELLEAPQFAGEIQLAPVNPRALISVLSLPELETQSPQALTRVTFDTRFQGDTEQFALDPLIIGLDETRIEGRVAVTDLSRNALEVVLQGNHINVDRYLPPAAEEEESEPGPEATGDEELIPLETVQGLVADVSMDFGRVQAMDMTFTDLSVRLEAEDGLVQLTRARLNAYQGKVAATAQLDGRGDTALIDFNSALDGIQVAPLLEDLEMDEDLQLSGALNAQAQGRTRGVTMNQLMDALTAEAEFSGAEVRLAPLNVEARFCQLVNLVNRTPGSEREWPEYTQMRKLSGRVTIADQVVKVESFEAGVSELTLGLLGQLDLKEEVYDFTLPMSLGSDSTSDTGCQIENNYWINRSLSLLRCRGSLAELDPISDCGFSKDGVESLVSEFAEHKIREEYQDELDAEKARAEEKLEEEKQELKDRAREKLLGDDAGDSKKTEDRLKRLFGR